MRRIVAIFGVLICLLFWVGCGGGSGSSSQSSNSGSGGGQQSSGGGSNNGGGNSGGSNSNSPPPAPSNYLGSYSGTGMLTRLPNQSYYVLSVTVDPAGNVSASATIPPAAGGGGQPETGAGTVDSGGNASFTVNNSSGTAAATFIGKFTLTNNQWQASGTFTTIIGNGTWTLSPS